MRLSEAASISNDVSAKNSVISAVVATLSMVTQVHLWHWQTTTYAEHKALGDYYEFLQSKVDELAEFFMGAGGSIKKFKHTDIKDYSKDAVRQAIQSYKDELAYSQRQLMNNENPAFDSMGDTILDIVKESDKVLYLLTLK